MKYSLKNPRTNSFLWRGTVIAIGHKFYCEQEGKRARLEILEADGNRSFLPLAQRSDPDLTVYEDVNQVFLKENLEPQVPKKKVKLVTSSQQENCDPVDDNYLLTYDQNDEMPNTAPELCRTLTPEEVNVVLSQIENENFDGAVEYGDKDDRVFESQEKDIDADVEPNNQFLKVRKIDKPKDSSTPANKKIKRAKTINPDDVYAMKMNRAENESGNAIKEAAEKISQAAEKISQAAVMISNCMQEFKPELKSLANRNYREIQMSTNAVKQLVGKVFCKNLSAK